MRNALVALIFGLTTTSLAQAQAQMQSQTLCHRNLKIQAQLPSSFKLPKDQDTVIFSRNSFQILGFELQYVGRQDLKDNHLKQSAWCLKDKDQKLTSCQTENTEIKIVPYNNDSGVAVLIIERDSSKKPAYLEERAQITVYFLSGRSLIYELKDIDWKELRNYSTLTVHLYLDPVNKFDPANKSDKQRMTISAAAPNDQTTFSASSLSSQISRMNVGLELAKPVPLRELHNPAEETIDYGYIELIDEPGFENKEAHSKIGSSMTRNIPLKMSFKKEKYLNVSCPSGITDEDQEDRKSEKKKH